ADRGELMHRRQAADINEISDLAMAAQSCRCCEDDIVANHAIMTDVAVVHEIAASSDSREAAALFGSNIHRHAFAKAASLPDLQPGRLTAIAQILRRSAKRDKWMDDATGADCGVPGHAYMRHQLAVRADHDMRANDAIRTDRRARADHCAILDPRGGVDRAHRMIRYRPVSFGVNVSGFQLVSAAQQDCPVTSDYPSVSAPWIQIRARNIPACGNNEDRLRPSDAALAAGQTRLAAAADVLDHPVDLGVFRIEWCRRGRIGFGQLGMR